ncbi:hypothetical protein VKT23_012635 [Stygiomarasmius scandens]|uniref:Uncharacterized protein n=1 Tax=Marasmiellus scandens TaxID=2682957 RepID=A0ABR1J5N8_9AGAR
MPPTTKWYKTQSSRLGPVLPNSTTQITLSSVSLLDLIMNQSQSKSCPEKNPSRTFLVPAASGTPAFAIPPVPQSAPPLPGPPNVRAPAYTQHYHGNAYPTNPFAAPAPLSRGPVYYSESSLKGFPGNSTADRLRSKF